MTAPSGDLEQLVVQIFSRFGHDPARLVREMDLEELNVDSLDLVELVLILEEDHGIVIGVDDIRKTNPQTLGDLIDLIVSWSTAHG